MDAAEKAIRARLAARQTRTGQDLVAAAVARPHRRNEQRDGYYASAGCSRNAPFWDGAIAHLIVWPPNRRLRRGDPKPDTGRPACVPRPSATHEELGPPRRAGHTIEGGYAGGLSFAKERIFQRLVTHSAGMSLAVETLVGD